jgi:hypothetical protein
MVQLFFVDILGPSMKSGLSKGTGHLDKRRFKHRLTGKGRWFSYGSRREVPSVSWLSIISKGKKIKA